METASLSLPEIGGFIFIILAFAGVVVSVMEKNARYFGIGTSIGLLAWSLLDKNSKYIQSNIRPFIWIFAGFGLFWIVSLIWSHKQVQEKVERIKNDSYVQSTGHIPADVISDPAIRSQLSKDQSVTLTNDSGAIGEYKIYQLLQQFTATGFKVLYNVYIPKSNDTTAEIDFLCITTIGLLVIESKNYSGKIYGYNNNINWTEYFHGGSKSTFYNPIMQNQNHIKALSEFLHIPESSMTSIVVFSDECELRKIPENSRNSVVIQLHDLLNLIVFLLQKREKIWTIEEVDSLYDRLSSLPTPTQEVKDKHIKDAKFAKFENLK